MTTGMPSISVKEYINNLIATYQYADRIYQQAVLDVAYAEKRRDEAESFQKEAHERLRTAQEMYGISNRSDSSTSPQKSAVSPLASTGRRLRKQSIAAKALPEGSRDNESTVKQSKASRSLSPKRMARQQATSQSPSPLPAVDWEILSPRKSIKQTIVEAQKNGIVSPLPMNSPSNEAGKLDGVKLAASALSAVDQELLSPRRPIKQMIASESSRSGHKSISSITDSSRSGHRATLSVLTANQGKNDNQENSASPSTPPQSPHSNALNQKRSIGAKSPSRRKAKNMVVSLRAFHEPKPVLDISKGRSREWFETNFDCDAVGLIRNFYQATFGTKTNERTKKTTVRTIVISDDINDLVSDTGELQSMLVTSSTDSSSIPTQKDRAALALLDPPASNPIAIFFAPKRALNTSDIFYVGHWKVVGGEIFDPPQMLRGELCQSRTEFGFVGIEPGIVQAINNDP